MAIETSCPFNVGDRIIDKSERIGTIKIINPRQFPNTHHGVIIDYDIKRHGCVWEGLQGAALVDWDTLAPLSSWLPYDYD